MFTSETKIRVRYAETDQMGVVYHSNFFLYFETARAESIRQLGLSYAGMEKKGIIMPVVEVQAKFIRPAKYDEVLTITTLLKEIPLNHKITFNHEVFNEGKELLACSLIILYFIHAATMKPAAMPPELSGKLKPYFL